MSRRHTADPRLAGRKQSICFFGLGSPHGDDHVGWIVAERLADEHLPGLRIARCRTPLELVHWADAEESSAVRCDRWIICDACQGMGPPGSIRRLEWPAMRCEIVSERPHSHGLGLVPVLELLDRLGRLAPGVVVFAIEIAGAAPDQPLSGAVRASVPRLVELIRQEIAAP